MRKEWEGAGEAQRAGGDDAMELGRQQCRVGKVVAQSWEGSAGVGQHGSWVDSMGVGKAGSRHVVTRSWQRVGLCPMHVIDSLLDGPGYYG